jgi:CheY-like chemotaxis protein
MSKPPDILLVEDDPGDVLLALNVFRSLQLLDRCAVATDGEDALAFLRTEGRHAQRPPGLPLLVLLDLKMPRVNGFEVLEQIRADARLRTVPVVALTSSREERDVARAYDLGVNGYVVKGTDFVEYRATLATVTAYWRQMNERPPEPAVHRRGLLRRGAARRAGEAFAQIRARLRAWLPGRLVAS